MGQGGAPQWEAAAAKCSAGHQPQALGADIHCISNSAWVRLVKVVHSQQQVRWFLLYIHLKFVRLTLSASAMVESVKFFCTFLLSVIQYLLGNVQAVIGSAQARMRVEAVVGRSRPGHHFPSWDSAANLSSPPTRPSTHLT